MRLSTRFETDVCILNCKTDFCSLEPSSANFAYQSQQKEIEEILQTFYRKNRQSAKLNMKKVSNILPIDGNKNQQKAKLMSYGSAILKLLESQQRFGFGSEDISNFIALDETMKTSTAKEVSFAKRLYNNMKVRFDRQNKLPCDHLATKTWCMHCTNLFKK